MFLEDGVIIICPKCETKYRYDERRFGGDSVKRVKCTTCGLTFEAANPAAGSVDMSVPTDLEDPSGSAGDGDSRNPESADIDTPLSPVQAQSPTPKTDENLPLAPLPTHLRYSLAVIAGGQAGSVFKIHQPRIFLGRGSAMDIQLRDSEVSRRHAMLEIRDSDVILADLGATNGTWFGGDRITTSPLSHQDEFTLGSTTLMLIVTMVDEPQ